MTELSEERRRSQLEVGVPSNSMYSFVDNRLRQSENGIEQTDQSQLVGGTSEYLFERKIVDGANTDRHVVRSRGQYRQKPVVTLANLKFICCAGRLPHRFQHQDGRPLIVNACQSQPHIWRTGRSSNFASSAKRALGTQHFMIVFDERAVF